MRIHVKADGHTIFLPIPSCLLTNSLSALLVYRFAVPHIGAVSDLTYAQVRSLLRALSRSRRKLKGQPLVEVDNRSGERVRIIL